MEKLEQQNKYYQPSIEEFCVGFEFEERYLDWKDKWSGWSKRTINNLINLDTFNRFIHKDFKYYEDIKEYEFRVKYLDSQDIIDCGFEFGEYSKGKFKNETIELYNKFSNIYTIHAIGDDYRDKLFEGTIKNKHELQIILKMIGVL